MVKHYFMTHRFIAASLLLMFCVWATGCTSTVREMVIRDELPTKNNEKIVETILESGEIVRFDDAGGHFRQNGTGQSSTMMIIGTTWDRKYVEVDPENVLGARIERKEFDAGGTVLLILSSITVGIFIFMIMAFSSS